MLKKISKSLLLNLTIVLIVSCNTSSKSTDRLVIPQPTRFNNQIEEFKSQNFDSQKDRIVFTGSSSIRGWSDIQSYYPKHQIINTGFGGSHMTDLFYFLEDAVFRFEPSKVFIYEGDNDLSAGFDTKTIMEVTNKVVDAIHNRFPECQVILIAAKPSLARWNIEDKYLKLNKEFRLYADSQSYIYFANVWDIMLDNNGEPIKSIFIQDGLHMNKSGYDLWDLVIKPFVEQ